MGLLNTKNPNALRALMTETIFDIGFSEIKEVEDLLNVSNEKGSGLENVEKQNNVLSSNETKTVYATEQRKQDSDIESSLQLYGDHKRNILFIVDQPGVQFFSKEAELAFLKTLEALKMALDDVAVINIAPLDQSIDFERIQKELAPVYWIFLGSDPTNVKLGEYPDNIWSKIGESQILKTYSFDEMLTDVVKKKAFWSAVKLISK